MLNKKFFLGALFVLLISSLSFADIISPFDVDLGDGTSFNSTTVWTSWTSIRDRYSMNGTVGEIDSVGAHGLSQTGTVSSTAGIIGNARGSDFSSANFLYNTDFWANFNNGQNFSVMFWAKNISQNTFPDCPISLVSDSTYVAHDSVCYNTNQMTFAMGKSIVGENYANNHVGNGWAMYTATFDASTNRMALFINTTENSSTYTQGLTMTATEYFQIGKLGSAPSSTGGYYVDEVRWYSTVISNAIINQTYYNVLGLAGYGNLESITVANFTNGYTTCGVINSTLMDAGMPCLINGASGVVINGSKQLVWTNCNPSRYFCYNSSSVYAVVNSIEDSCLTFGIANTINTLTSSVSINDSTCFNITAANVTLNCNGNSINGNNAAGRFGVYTTQPNTTIMNCNISNFHVGIYANGILATNQNISGNNITITSTNLTDPFYASGILFYNGANGTIVNNNVYSASGIGVFLYDSSVNGVTNNNVMSGSYYGMTLSAANSNIIQNNNVSSTSNAGIYVSASSNNSLINNTAYSSSNVGIYYSSTNTSTDTLGKYSSGTGYAANYYNGTNNTIANGSYSSGGAYSVYFGANSSSNLFYNNSLASTSTPLSLLYLEPTAGGNIFYWNNFTATTGLYANDTNGTNGFNTTISAQNAGNIWANVFDGSTVVLGTGTPPFSGFYYGNRGNNYPYNQTTSNNKVAGLTDYAPLTSSATLTCRNLSISNLTYTADANQTASGTSCYTFTANNITLDCNQTTITGNGVANVYAVIIRANNSIMLNCNFRNWSSDVLVNDAFNTTIHDSTFATPIGLIINNSNNGTYYNLNFSNITQDAIIINQSNYNILAQNKINVTGNAIGMYFSTTLNNTIYNNTFFGAGTSTHLRLESGAVGNLFYWNNFTDAGTYINDSGTNYYDGSVSGVAAGNIYANVINGSALVQGNLSPATPFSGLYYGRVGLNYPYNSSTSLGKILGTANDYGPLTPTLDVAPSTIAPILSPTLAYVSTPQINCTNSTTTSPFGTPITLNYLFYVNGNSTGITTPYLLIGNYKQFDNVTCQITPYDSFLYGASNNSSVLTISNQVPVMQYVEILNLTGGYVIPYASWKVGMVRAADADNNNVSYQYNWELYNVGNTSMNSTTNYTQGTTVNVFNDPTFASRQVYRLWARAYDGSNYSDWLASYYIIVTNNGHVVSGTLNSSSNPTPVVALNSPASGSSTATLLVTYFYNSTYSKTYTDELWVDGALIDQRDYLLNQLNLSTDRLIQSTFTYTMAPGIHTYYIQAKDILNSTYVVSPTYTFTVIATGTSYTGSYNISQTFQNTVYASPERLWIDENGLINAMYFYANNGSNTTYLALTEISPSLGSPLYYYITTLNRTNDYYLNLRFPNATYHLYTYDGNTNKLVNITYRTGTIDVNTLDSSYNITNNNYFTPDEYAYTLQYPTITYAAGTNYLYWLPVTNGTYLMTRTVPGNVESVINYTSNSVVWQTIAADSTLDLWYYAYPSNSSCGAGDYNVGVYSFDGILQTFLGTPDPTCYSAGVISQTKTFFDTYNGTYYFTQYTPSNITIYRLSDSKNITLTGVATQIGYMMFVDKDSPAFFAKEGGTDYIYTCYFGGTTPSCTKTLASGFVAALPVDYRGQMTTIEKTPNENVLHGQIAGGLLTTLFYNSNTYDTKITCLDEQYLTRLLGNYRILSSTYSTTMTPGDAAWEYVTPSAPFGNSTKSIFSLCQNGTSRQYYQSTLGTSNVFSLISTAGSYYTFSVTDCYQQPVYGAVVSSYRYLTDRQAWTVVEQTKTQVNGAAALFLEPEESYEISFDTSGTTTNGQPTTINFIPTTSTAVAVSLTCNGNANADQSYENVGGDLSVVLTPAPVGSVTNQSFNITFQTYSLHSWLASSNLLVYRTDSTSGTRTLITNYTCTGSQSCIMPNIFISNNTGAALYEMYANIYTQRGSSTNQTVLVTRSSSIQLLNYNAITQNVTNLLGAHIPIGGWAWLFLTTVFTMLVMGYLSRYSIDGAGVGAVFVFWFFSLVNNTSLAIPGLGLINMIVIATIITAMAIFVIGWRYI